MPIVYELFHTEPPPNAKKMYAAVLGAVDSKRKLIALLGRVHYDEAAKKYVCEKIAPEVKPLDDNAKDTPYEVDSDEPPVIIGMFKKESDAIACLWEAKSFLFSKWT